MKKLLSFVLAGLFVATFAVPAMAADMGSELEISGNTTVVTGWQRVWKGTGSALGGSLETVAAAPTAKGDNSFGFAVDQFELDFAKSFGENIRLRSDVDFTPTSTRVGGAVVNLEQAYVTANIPAGNGAELLIGHYNSGIGLDPYDKNELHTLSFSMPRRLILPLNLTGARLGYQATDAVWVDFSIVNSLQDAAPFGANSAYPAFALNVKYGWGSEDAANWVKVSVAEGAETAVNKNMTLLGDLSANLALMDGSLNVGLEGFYRADGLMVATGNGKLYGGVAQATYAFSDIWDGTFRYGFTWDNDTVVTPAANMYGAPSGLAIVKAKLHDVTLATGYQITDGAKFVVEGRMDIYSATSAAASYATGLGAQFAYNF